MRPTSGARALLLLSLWLGAAPAQARAKGGGGEWTASDRVPVFSEPAAKQAFSSLARGEHAPFVKRGGPGGAWCRLDLGAKIGWVECDRGTLGGSEAPVPAALPKPVEAVRPEATAGRASGCATSCSHAPLFAALPALTAADREVLALCPANPEASVSSPDARRFFAAHYDDPRLQRALSAAGRPGSKEANLAWLTGLWVGTGPRNAFTHVFCGDDWTTDKLGGLHFLPRYAALEREGKLCYGGPVKGTKAIAGGQYLVRFTGVAPWSCARKAVGGFTIDHDPVQIVATGVRAFARCCARDGGSKEGGVYAAPDLGGQAWRVWCGTRNGTYGIASLYPTDERVTCGE